MLRGVDDERDIDRLRDAAGGGFEGQEVDPHIVVQRCLDMHRHRSAGRRACGQTNVQGQRIGRLGIWKTLRAPLGDRQLDGPFETVERLRADGVISRFALVNRLAIRGVQRNAEVGTASRRRVSTVVAPSCARISSRTAS